MFVKIVHRSALQTIGLLAGIALAGAALLAWPQAVATGVSRGLSICSTVIIPSLFPFLVLAGFLVRSGLCRRLGRWLEKPTRRLFGLPGCCAGGILIGWVGGYPAGGAAIGELIREGSITPDQGKRMLRCCVNGGPAFIVSAVGAAMMGHIAAGWVLFAAHILASLLLGLGQQLIRGRRLTSPVDHPAISASIPRTSLPTAFVESVHTACRSLLYMCGFVVLFAALLSLCDVSGITAFFQYLFTRPLALAGGDVNLLPSLFPGILEVSCGCVEVARAGELAPFWLGFFLGWGGLSVHGQLAASLQGLGLIDRRFFLARLLHGLLGGGLSMLLMRIIPLPLDVFSPLQDAVLAPYSTSAAASVALLLMGAMLLVGRRKASAD